ncbi:MAG TPA: class I SAM-dependent methyltransferase [Vicinamibacterales bacterium]|nr:class I SAM-dependent methyltransferase [Vicinamibacterales bacterium]
MIPVFLLAATLAATGAQAQERPKPEQIYRHAPLEVHVPDFAAQGLILDIGGGGEGIIGQIKGRQVVAIDLSKRELDEAPGNPLLKIVMDARDLKFADASFDTVTVFFTFMYIAPADHEKVLAEIARVLRPSGRLLVWDVTFPAAKTDERQEWVVYPLQIQLPATRVETGYGVRFATGRGARQLVAAARKAGFETVTRQDESGWYFLEMSRPPAR